MNELFRRFKARVWERRGRVPHAYGYNAARWAAIERGLRSRDPRLGWDGAGFDERVVEYAWMFQCVAALGDGAARVLDAGSVLNHARILACWREARFPPVSIVTLAYEGRAHVSPLARYEFADLRQLPYRDAWFSATISLSTLEHVGLDTAVYGAPAPASSDPGAEALRAMRELRRVTARGGRLLLSVPFGARSHRGWLRVFDAADLERLLSGPGWGNLEIRCFRAAREGWRECSLGDAANCGYNEPPGGGSRTAPAWVAAAEAVVLVQASAS